MKSNQRFHNTRGAEPSASSSCGSAWDFTLQCKHQSIKSSTGEREAKCHVISALMQVRMKSSLEIRLNPRSRHQEKLLQQRCWPLVYNMGLKRCSIYTCNLCFFLCFHFWSCFLSHAFSFLWLSDELCCLMVKRSETSAESFTGSTDKLHGGKLLDFIISFI